MRETYVPSVDNGSSQQAPDVEGSRRSYNHAATADSNRQWRRSVVKYGSQGQSGQAFKLFQAPRKIIFTFHFWYQSFILDDVKPAELSNNSFEWKNVVWHFRGSKHTPSDPSYIFSGAQDPQTPTRCVRPIDTNIIILFMSMGRTQRIEKKLAARTRWGSLSAPPDPLAAMRGPTSKGKGRGDRGGEERGRERRGGEGRGRDEGKE